jgi:hypothetical protein
MSKAGQLARKDNVLLDLFYEHTIGVPGANGYVKILRIGEFCIVSGYIGSAGVDRPTVYYGGVNFIAPPVVQVTPVADSPVGTHHARVAETEGVTSFAVVRSSGTPFNWTAIGKFSHIDF